LISAAVASLLLLGSSVMAPAQQVHQVMLMIRESHDRPVPEFYFEATGLYIQPGDTVRFVGATPHHTATAYHALQGKVQRVPEGAEPFSSPMSPIGGYWEYTFDIPGVYDIFCGPREQYGMAMRIVVGEATGPATEPVTDFSPFGAMGTAGLVLNDPALAPDRIIEAGSVSWDDLSPDSKVLVGP